MTDRQRLGQTTTDSFSPSIINVVSNSGDAVVCHAAGQKAAINCNVCGWLNVPDPLARPDKKFFFFQVLFSVQRSERVFGLLTKSFCLFHFTTYYKIIKIVDTPLVRKFART